MVLPSYCTREDISSALDDKSRPWPVVDRAVYSASRSVEQLTHRRFYPETDTRVFNWPRGDYARSWRLWLGSDELISVSALTSGGDAITEFFLEPANQGPPFTSLDVDLSGSGAFSAGDTFQQSIHITGDFGAASSQVPAGALASALSTTTGTSIDITDGSLVGVGDTLTCESERLIVTGRTWLTSAQTGSLTSSKADVTLAVATGSAFHAGEVILLGSETCLITDVSGNNLTVKRAQAGSVLAAHVTATIYVSRTLTVTRGALGTTAATHLTAMALTKLDPPSLVRSLTIAFALDQLLQESGGYSQTTGSGSTKDDAPGVGLDALIARCYKAHGRKGRVRTI